MNPRLLLLWVLTDSRVFLREPYQPSKQAALCENLPFQIGLFPLDKIRNGRKITIVLRRLDVHVWLE
jgi:hypothetical protein